MAQGFDSDKLAELLAQRFEVSACLWGGELLAPKGARVFKQITSGLCVPAVYLATHSTAPADH